MIKLKCESLVPPPLSLKDTCVCACVCIREYINKANSFFGLSSLQGEEIRTNESRSLGAARLPSGRLTGRRNKATDMNSRDVSGFLTITCCRAVSQPPLGRISRLVGQIYRLDNIIQRVKGRHDYVSSLLWIWSSWWYDAL